MKTIRYISKKNMKYGGKFYQVGDPITPSGGKWDDDLFDPSNGYVREEKVIEHECHICGDTFGSAGWLTRHMNEEHQGD